MNAGWRNPGRDGATMSLAEMRNTLATLRRQVDKRQQERRNLRIEKSRSADDEHGRRVLIPVSRDVLAFFSKVQRAVLADQRRYVAAAEPVIEQPSTALAEQAVPVADRGQFSAPRAMAEAPDGLLNGMLVRWQEMAQVIPTRATDKLQGPAAVCFALMHNELELMTREQSERMNVSLPVLSKLQQAVRAFEAGRAMDTVTLLKNVLQGDPHNHTILALLSQVLYYLTNNQAPTMLPEAREFAQRSMIFSEKIRPERLMFYRYLALSSERHFGHERVLEWVRETGVLEPKNLMGKDGLLSHGTLPLRVWALLASITPDVWTTAEFEAMRDVTLRALGGAALYVVWFHPQLVHAVNLPKPQLELVDEVEKNLHLAYENYSEVARSMRQLPLQTGSMGWFVRVRFLNTMAQVCPTPSFDQVLFYMALDGRAWRENVFPDQELRMLLQDSTLNYWYMWAMVVTPFKDVRLPYLLPADETVSDGPLLAHCDKLLNSLKVMEKERIKPTVWADIKPWLTNWQMDHLLAAGIGSNKPRQRFTPNLIPYNHFYRRWQLPMAINPLASELIAETARRGGFASFYEIIAAFEGALRLIDDPRFGLLANQREALERGRKHDPKKFGNMAIHDKGAGGMMMVLLPVGMMGLATMIFHFSANFGQAAGLVLALLGVGGVLMMNMKKG
ncbi:MAG: hypothetical protein EBQ80_02570 [Proteobacteria bacterium]|nr:hypothetical protein [Pseudomonadota bacterium]